MASPFRKAKVEQAAIKMALYGPQGSGKTFTALLCAEGLAKLTGKRIAFLDTEHGTDFYSADTRNLEQPRFVHPEAFDFDVVHTRSLSDAIAAVRSLESSPEYGVIIIDSISHLWQSAMLAYKGKETSAGTLPFHAWGKIKKPYKWLIDALMSSTKHLFICGREKNVFRKDPESGETEHVGVAMRAEGETPYEPHICLNMHVEQPNLKAKGGMAQRATYVAFGEKDRTGVLAGRCFSNPGFDELIKPILPMLTGEQAHIQTEDDRRIQDSEAQEDEDDARHAESADAVRTYTGRFMAAASLDAVEFIGCELTPARKKVFTASDLLLVRAAYLEAKNRTKVLTTPAVKPEPDVPAEPKPKKAKAAKAKPEPVDSDAEPATDAELDAAAVTIYKSNVTLYNSMTPEQLGPIRIEKNFGMISEYEGRPFEDQNDLRIAMEEAATEEAP